MTFGTQGQGQIPQQQELAPSAPTVMTLQDIMTLTGDIDDLDLGDEEEEEEKKEQVPITLSHLFFIWFQSTLLV